MKLNILLLQCTDEETKAQSCSLAQVLIATKHKNWDLLNPDLSPEIPPYFIV